MDIYIAIGYTSQATEPIHFWFPRCLKSTCSKELICNCSLRENLSKLDVHFRLFRSPVCPIYPAGSTRGERGVGSSCWPPPGPTALRCYEEPVAAAMQSFTAWRHNLLAISAAAAAAGATSAAVYRGRCGLEQHRPPTVSPVMDAALSLRFDHCRLPTSLMMSHQDACSDLNNTGIDSFITARNYAERCLRNSISVCPSVCPSVRHTPILCQMNAGWCRVFTTG